MSKIEFIESYVKIGSEYHYNDNHDELIRCKDCTMFDDKTGHCINPMFADREKLYAFIRERGEMRVHRKGRQDSLPP